MLLLHIYLSFVENSMAVIVFVIEDYVFSGHLSHQLVTAGILFLVLIVLSDTHRYLINMYCREK